ncbi:hypothetical protein SUGI_0687920 [Cryptomeria japonica]|nr:hypothetical protein SUGI_0687920 [Cryptomeria japonica]
MPNAKCQDNNKCYIQMEMRGQRIGRETLKTEFKINRSSDGDCRESEGVRRARQKRNGNGKLRGPHTSHSNGIIRVALMQWGHLFTANIVLGWNG